MPMSKSSSIRRAFSLVELLFAVMILGIGIIGIAAVLYAGVVSSTNTVDQSNAASVARTACAVMSRALTAANTPETGNAYATIYSNASLYNEVCVQQLAVGDKRYAWIPVYRRASGSKIAELLIVVVRARARDNFTLQDLRPYDPTDAYPPALVPHGLSLELRNNQLRLVRRADAELLSPGAVIVTNSTDATGHSAGRVFQVSGRADSTGEYWDLTPGQDMSSDPTPYIGQAYVVSRGYADPTNPANGYAGIAQPVATYTTIVSLR